jgi:hypothetical protein
MSAGIGIGTTVWFPCTAQIANVSGGTGISSTWPVTTCTEMSAAITCMPSCG